MWLWKEKDFPDDANRKQEAYALHWMKIEINGEGKCVRATANKIARGKCSKIWNTFACNMRERSLHCMTWQHVIKSEIFREGARPIQ